MNLPAIPLITIDPYFSVWAQTTNSKYRTVDTKKTMHWTCAGNTVKGIVKIDGKEYSFLGDCNAEPLKQISHSTDALSTIIIYEGGGIRLTSHFTSPLLADDLYYSSRPVSYLKLSFESIDGEKHSVSAKISCGDDMCLNGEGEVITEKVDITGLSCIKMGNKEQKILNKSGDDVKIDWGYLYLAAQNANVYEETADNTTYITIEKELQNTALFLFAYDDIYSIEYFGKYLKAYWKKDGKTITEALKEAAAEYDSIIAGCNSFSKKLETAAIEKGGKKYSELLVSCYRQVMAAHKLVVDGDGNNLYISKECFSNGCAATVDVTYPSAPMYLYFNTELLKGMLRPIFKFANSEDWEFDFAPHDVGQYPLLNGQAYGPHDINMQMPIEECGNMLILTFAICKKENDYTFAKENFETLEKWSKYLIDFGEDPKNQLCTDDFAGHLAHNCNLSIKAIMGLIGFSGICGKLGMEEKANQYENIAKFYAESFLERAKNKDGSFRLAYNKAETFSLKYNAVWDKLWVTELLPKSFFEGEIARYKKEALPYGVPLDNRELYTTSNWLLWAACLTDNSEDFEFFVNLLWSYYNTTRKHIPMNDWYYADTAEPTVWTDGKKDFSFQNRTVQGGLFIKLLFD